jgi:magnesium chelatase subunit I
VYGEITGWFEQGNSIEISDELSCEEYFRELDRVRGLRELTLKQMQIDGSNRHELASAMEFALDGLHQFSKIARDEVDRTISYKDMVGSILSGRGKTEIDD